MASSVHGVYPLDNHYPVEKCVIVNYILHYPAVNVNAQLKGTHIVGEGKGRSIVQDPSAACCMGGQSLELAGQRMVYKP